MTNLIFNGNDPNTTLPNAPSIDSFTTLSYDQVYGNLDGSGVTINTDGAMLPEGFRDLQVWKDFMSCVEEVLGSPVASYIQSLLGMREPYFASTDPSIDRVTLLKIMNFIGFKYAQNDIFDDDDLRRFVRHTPLFWMEKGNRNFIQYMSFVINAQLSMQYLWTQDYVNFYPEGSSAIGKLITDPSRNLTANQQQFAIGGTSTTAFTLGGPNGLPIDTLAQPMTNLSAVRFWQSNGSSTSAQLLDAAGIPLTASQMGSVTGLHRTDWQGRQLQYPTPRTNYAKNSQNMLGSGWNVRTETVTTNNAGAPDGSATLNKVVISTSNTAHAQSQDIAGIPNGTLCTLMISVNPAGAPFTTIWLADQLASGGPAWYIILNSAGKVTYNSGSLTNGAATVVTGLNGMYQVYIQGVITAGTARCAVGFSNTGTSVIYTYTGNGTDTYSAWGMMLSQGVSINQLGSYIATTSAAVTVTADYGVSGNTITFPTAPIAGGIYDWDGSAIPSPVIFSSSTWAGVDQLYPTPRTNLMTNTTTVGSSGWTTSNVTVTTGQTTLDGTTNANKILATTSAGYVRSAAITVTAKTYYTDSVYVNTTGMPATQTLRMRVVDSTTPTTILGSVDFQLNTTTSGGVTVQTLISTANTGNATFSIYPTPIVGWYRVGITVYTAASVGVMTDILPDITNGTGSITAVYSAFEYGLKFTKYTQTFTSTVTVTDYSISGSVVTVPAALPVSTNLLWSGTYNQLGTWYQTSHVYIVYDVNKFASTVNSGFSSQQAMEQFFYSISPIELVVRGFVLNLTLPPTHLYLAGDVHVKVLQPTNVDAANLYPNALYPLPQ